jgi:hypothetical protein
MIDRELLGEEDHGTIHTAVRIAPENARSPVEFEAGTLCHNETYTRRPRFDPRRVIASETRGAHTLIA